MDARATPRTHSADRLFLNRYYGVSRHFYDLTRKYYLFGRDRLLDQMGDEKWEHLIEVGPGTGRNLRRLHTRRPSAKFGGIDASDAMLDHARARCPFATLGHGFAEVADYAQLLGGPPERILFSYCLSMVSQPFRAIDHARSQLAPGGEIAIVDFGDLAGLPRPLGYGLRRWISAFHVKPLDDAELERRAARIEYGPGRYFVIARIR